MTRHAVEVKVLCKDEEIPLPQYSSTDAAGADLRAWLTADVVLAPGERALISTGLRMELPQGYELQIRPRSGLALQHGISVLNTPGTVDSDYRGEVGVILINLGHAPFIVTHGMRIAQAVLAPVVHAQFVCVDASLQETKRGAGGFGHTGHQ